MMPGLFPKFAMDEPGVNFQRGASSPPVNANEESPPDGGGDLLLWRPDTGILRCDRKKFQDFSLRSK